jgi:hypothetical protein
MPLSDETITTAERLLVDSEAAEFAAVFAALRAALPDLVVLRCDASDVLEDPYRSYPAFDLHLVDTRNHCTVMTVDPSAATGLLIAAKAVAA